VINVKRVYMIKKNL